MIILDFLRMEIVSEVVLDGDGTINFFIARLKVTKYPKYHLLYFFFKFSWMKNKKEKEQ